LSNTAYGIILGLLTGLFAAILSQLYRKQGDDKLEQATFHLVLCWSRFLFSFLFIFLFGAKIGGKIFLTTSVASGLAQTGNFILVLYGIMMGPIAISYGIIWLAAPAVALAWAIYSGNEPWTMNQFIGLAFFIICIPTLAISTYRHNKDCGEARPVMKAFFPIMVVAMLFGTTDGYFAKYSNGYDAQAGSPAIYALIISFIVALGLTIYHLILRHKFRYSPVVFKYAVLAGLVISLQIATTAYGFKFIHVSRFLPIIASSAIILSAIFSAYFHKEIPSPATILGLAMSIGAIIFLALG